MNVKKLVKLTKIEKITCKELSCQDKNIKKSEFDWPSNVSVRSVDMQKIIMLPRMPGVKTIAFTKRIIAFQETFAAVGTKPKRLNILIVWHEVLAGRSSSEIASCFETVIRYERDISFFIFWVDNCSSQNKNWCLFSFLTTIVNLPNIAAKEIILKFFETGHTFMSADSVHADVEKVMRCQKHGDVYDFRDFVEVVKNSNSRRMVVIESKASGFRKWTKLQSQSKANCASICQLQENVFGKK